MAIMLKAAGLHTFNNDLDAVPVGALLKAENTIIDRTGIIESRRGFKQYGTISVSSNDFAKQLFSYKNTILSHYSNKLSFDNGSGVFTNFDGTYEETQTGLRIKGIESQGNFYFTTNDGVKKISITNSSQFSNAVNFIRDAGAVKALDIEATIDYSQPGFLEQESKVAYRVVWGYKDANDLLLLGTPSARTVVTNISTTDSGVVSLTFPIPTEIQTTDTQFFYQIYRTAVKLKGLAPSLDDIDPGDEMFLVLEDYPTSNELTVTRMVEAEDVTPEDFRASGTPLYTNINSGEGIAQANEAPPLAKDIALFQGSVFYANTRTKSRLQLSLLSVSQLISGTSTITITNGPISNTYTFIGVPEITDFTFDTQVNTNDAGYFIIYSANNERAYFVWFNKTGATPAPSNAETLGKLGIEVDISAAITDVDVAVAVKNAVNTIAGDDFIADNTLAVVTIDNAKNGFATDAFEGLNVVGGVFAINVTQQGEGEDLLNLEVLLSSAATPAQQIDESARSLVRIINQNTNESVYAFYLSGPDDLPGIISLEARDISTQEFYVIANDTITSSQFNPSLPVADSGSAAIGDPSTITSVAHGLSNGQTIIVYNSTTTPTIDGEYTISNVTVNTFDIDVDVDVAGNIDFAISSVVFSTDEESSNRVYYSKYQQSEAVPLLNYFDVGPKDQVILRIIALRDSLFILKEDGIYRLTGSIAPNFTVNLFDNSAILLAPDSAVVLNNQIYMLSTQGIVRVTDTGVEVVSRPIEDKISKLIIQSDNYKTATFGVAYETDRSYLFWYPENVNDTKATRCLRFNSFTTTWTEWDKSNTCGVVNPGDDVMYLGSINNIIQQERKNLERTDYADYQFDLNIASNSVNDETITLSSNLGIVAGDIIVQQQYVTISTYNRLLRKLDLDIFLEGSYLSSLEMVPGDSLSNKMAALVLKLNNDPSTTLVYTFSGTTNFATIQTEFNTIITNLNNDPGVFLSNYIPSTGFQLIEGNIVEVIKNTNKVVLNLITPFMVGTVTHYVGIDNDIIYAPQHFGDPSVLKQINEATFMFEDTVFTSASVAYSSDLSTSFEFIEFEGVGDGSWGNFVWSEQSWGGEGDQVPLRTYIPLEKQRCRFLKPRFQHGNAWEKYAIQGISLNPRVLSTRGYR